MSSNLTHPTRYATLCPMLLNQAIPVPSPHPQFRVMLNGKHLRPTYPTEREARAAGRRAMLQGACIWLTQQNAEWLEVGRDATAYYVATTTLPKYRVGDAIGTRYTAGDLIAKGPRAEVISVKRVTNPHTDTAYDIYTLRQVAP